MGAVYEWLREVVEDYSTRTARYLIRKAELLLEAADPGDRGGEDEC